MYKDSLTAIAAKLCPRHHHRSSALAEAITLAVTLPVSRILALKLQPTGFVPLFVSVFPVKSSAPTLGRTNEREFL